MFKLLENLTKSCNLCFNINISLLGIDFPTTTTDDYFRANTMHLWQNLGAAHNGTTREVTGVFISVKSRPISVNADSYPVASLIRDLVSRFIRGRKEEKKKAPSLFLPPS